MDAGEGPGRIVLTGSASPSLVRAALGVSSHTADSDLDVLEQTFMIRRPRPYHANEHKRLTKSPKVYLRDTGPLHFLAGLREPRELDTWARFGWIRSARRRLGCLRRGDERAPPRTPR